MPWVCERRLPDLLDVTAVTRAGRKITDDVGTRLMEATRARTPIDTSYTGGLARRGPDGAPRPRGTARASVQREQRIRGYRGPRGRGWQIRVFTEDPVFPYIEWTTRPHEIRPTPEHQARAAAEGRTAHLQFYSRGSVRFALVVHHPGTKGQHPFSRAALFVAEEVSVIAEPAMREFRRELVVRR